MKPIAQMMYEILPDEIKQLPNGFQIFRHSEISDTWMLFSKEEAEDEVADYPVFGYTYYLMKIPPATFRGHAGK